MHHSDNSQLKCNHTVLALDQFLDPSLIRSDHHHLEEESGDMVAVHAKCLVGPGIVQESHVHLTASATRICRFDSDFANIPSEPHFNIQAPLSPCQ